MAVEAMLLVVVLARQRLCYELDVRPSVRLSVTLVDCGGTVQQKV